MRRKWYFWAPLAILGMAAFVFIGGEIVQQLWNWLLPALFGLRRITFWQAIGILLLCRILFGGFGGHGPSRSNIRHRIAGRMAERWGQMTPEQRERFRQGLRGCGGFGAPTGESEGR